VNQLPHLQIYKTCRSVAEHNRLLAIIAKMEEEATQPGNHSSFALPILAFESQMRRLAPTLTIQQLNLCLLQLPKSFSILDGLAKATRD
jgi:hypothetical protein